MISLCTQNVVPASSSNKIRLSLLATALADALGGPTEFRRRFSFQSVTSMIPNSNFSLPKGVWTDDTSMALCLARSIASCKARGVKDGFDEHDQLIAYINWWSHGELSAIGRCFDIGNTISGALSIYAPYADKHGASAATEGLAKIKAQMDHEYSSGNGSLMRILPVGLAYWKSEEKARTYARRSSMTTHPNEMCQETCEVWTGAIVRTMQAACAAESDVDLMPFSKLDLLHYIASFPYRNQKLREALAAPGPDISSSSSKSERDLRLEEHYRTHHPVLKLLADREKSRGRRTGEELNLPSEKELSSSGYVLHTIVAALYCFLASSTFEEGAILAANLGNDSDTVGAVYAGLAGCWYGGNELEYSGEDGGETRFWNSRVNEWKEDLVMKNLIKEVSEQLVKFDAEWV